MANQRGPLEGFVANTPGSVEMGSYESLRAAVWDVARAVDALRSDVDALKAEPVTGYRDDLYTSPQGWIASVVEATEALRAACPEWQWVLRKRFGDEGDQLADALVRLCRSHPQGTAATGTDRCAEFDRRGQEIERLRADVDRTNEIAMEALRQRDEARADVERMRPVVEAARAFKGLWNGDIVWAISKAVIAYDAAEKPAAEAHAGVPCQWKVDG